MQIVKSIAALLALCATSGAVPITVTVEPCADVTSDTENCGTEALPCLATLGNGYSATSNMAELTYSQVRPAHTACGTTVFQPYTKSIFVKFSASGDDGKVVLSPDGLKALCISQCSKTADGAFCGMCGADASGCNDLISGSTPTEMCVVGPAGSATLEEVENTSTSTTSTTSGASSLFLSAVAALIPAALH